MRSIINIIPGALFVCALIMSVSCTPGSCFEETNAYLKASFYLQTTGKLAAPDTLTLILIGKDTARYNKALKVQPALFPLNPSEDNCGFLIRINGVTDTISFMYSTYTHLISKECGYTYYHHLDSVSTTKNIIDKIEIKQNTVTNLDGPNIFIYY